MGSGEYWTWEWTKQGTGRDVNYQIFGDRSTETDDGRNETA
jgi:hypothetical protein